VEAEIDTSGSFEFFSKSGSGSGVSTQGHCSGGKSLARQPTGTLTISPAWKKAPAGHRHPRAFGYRQSVRTQTYMCGAAQIPIRPCLAYAAAKSRGAGSNARTWRPGIRFLGGREGYETLLKHRHGTRAGSLRAFPSNGYCSLSRMIHGIHCAAPMLKEQAVHGVFNIFCSQGLLLLWRTPLFTDAFRINETASPIAFWVTCCTCFITRISVCFSLTAFP